jgi:hypothetical protein
MLLLLFMNMPFNCFYVHAIYIHICDTNKQTNKLTNKQTNKQTSWLKSASELYRPSYPAAVACRQS